MARKKVIDLNADSTVKFGRQEGALPKGSTFEGYYVGSKTVQSSMGPSQLHVFQTDDGSVGVWGSAQLNQKLQGLQGMKTFIKFVNEIKVPKGRMKVFEVEYDDEDTIDVAGTQVNFRQAEEPESDDDAEFEADDAAEEEAEEEPEEEAKPAVQKKTAPQAFVAQKPRATTPSPEAQARTAALLKGKK
jgi:hypothetical protein